MAVDRLQQSFHARADRKRFENRRRNPFLRKKEKLLADRIARALGPSERLPAAVLEVGGGEGSNLLYLRERLPGCFLAGLDFSLDKARFQWNHCHGTVAVCGDALRLPFRSESFDVVFCRDLLHHVHWAREEMLAEAMRLVRPGGSVLVFESDGRTLLNRLFRFCFPVEKGMRDSTPLKLIGLGKRFGDARLDWVEASFVVRAIGFFLGWPKGIARYAVAPVYALGAVWELVMAWLLPKRAWCYMLLCLRKN